VTKESSRVSSRVTEDPARVVGLAAYLRSIGPAQQLFFSPARVSILGRGSHTRRSLTVLYLLSGCAVPRSTS
jgi:hypothetical protein